MGLLKRKSYMEAKKLMILSLTSFCLFVSALPVAMSLPSDRLTENMGDKGMDEHNKSTNATPDGSSSIANYRKVANGHGATAASGGSGAPAVAGNGGGSSSPYVSGGTFVPLYAAGAAHNHQNKHHNAASCRLNCMELSILAGLIMNIPLLLAF